MTAEQTITPEEIKDGDIFEWRYRNRAHDSQGYWCKSRIAVAKDGILCDTYWSSLTDGSFWAYADACQSLELTRIANLSELQKQPEHMADYYDDADIVNLNHANSHTGNFYIRVGAERSRAKMMQVLANRIRKAAEEIASLKRRVQWLMETQAEIEAGTPLDGICI